MIATTTQKNRTTTPKKEIQALGRFPYSTRYFCSMLQFYLAKIIKRSEFYYADFDYMMGMGNESYRKRNHSQRLMSFPNNCANHSLSFLASLISLLISSRESSLSSLFSAFSRADRKAERASRLMFSELSEAEMTKGILRLLITWLMKIAHATRELTPWCYLKTDPLVCRMRTRTWGVLHV